MRQFSVAITSTNGDIELNIVDATSEAEALGIVVRTAMNMPITSWQAIEIPARVEPKVEIVPGLNDVMLRFLIEGKKIHAIKEYRRVYGADLKSTKEAIEAIMTDLGFTEAVMSALCKARDNKVRTPTRIYDWWFDGVRLNGRIENHPEIASNCSGITSPVISISSNGLVTTRSGTEYELHDINEDYDREVAMDAIARAVEK
jgi:ribosomal protein L7/L12